MEVFIPASDTRVVLQLQVAEAKIKDREEAMEKALLLLMSLRRYKPFTIGGYPLATLPIHSDYFNQG